MFSTFCFCSAALYFSAAFYGVFFFLLLCCCLVAALLLTLLSRFVSLTDCDISYQHEKSHVLLCDDEGLEHLHSLPYSQVQLLIVPREKELVDEQEQSDHSAMDQVDEAYEVDENKSKSRGSKGRSKAKCGKPRAKPRKRKASDDTKKEKKEKKRKVHTKEHDEEAERRLEQWTSEVDEKEWTRVLDDFKAYIRVASVPKRKEEYYGYSDSTMTNYNNAAKNMLQRFPLSLIVSSKFEVCYKRSQESTRNNSSGSAALGKLKDMNELYSKNQKEYRAVKERISVDDPDFDFTKSHFFKR